MRAGHCHARVQFVTPHLRCLAPFIRLGVGGRSRHRDEHVVGQLCGSSGTAEDTALTPHRRWRRLGKTNPEPCERAGAAFGQRCCLGHGADPAPFDNVGVTSAQALPADCVRLRRAEREQPIRRRVTPFSARAQTDFPGTAVGDDVHRRLRRAACGASRHVHTHDAGLDGRWWHGEQVEDVRFNAKLAALRACCSAACNCMNLPAPQQGMDGSVGAGVGRRRHAEEPRDSERKDTKIKSVGGRHKVPAPLHLHGVARLRGA